MSVSSFGSTDKPTYAFSVSGDIETTLNVPTGAYEVLSDISSSGSAYIGESAISAMHSIKNGQKFSFYKSIPAANFPTFYDTNFVGLSFNPGSISAGAYGNEMYVLGGSNQGNSPQAYYSNSPYGTWAAVQPISVGTSVRAIIYANNQFVLAGSGGYLSRSVDGVTWTTAIQLFGGQEIWGLAYGNGVYVAVASAGNLATSPDGITWTTRTSQFGSSLIFSVAFANNLFVAVGDLGKISTSVDGVTWTARTQTFITSAIQSVAFGASLFVAVGQSGKIGTSPDGITWTNRTSGSVQPLYSIDYANGKFVVVGGNTAFLTSNDGISWASPSVSLGMTGTLNVFKYLGEGGVLGSGVSAVAPTFSQTAFNGIGTITAQAMTYANGLYVMIGAAGGIQTSSDAITWTTRVSGTTNNLIGISYVNGLFIIVGQNGVILSSTDGITWTSVTSPTSYTLYGVTYGKGLYVIVGTLGVLFTSPDLATWTSRSSKFYSNRINAITFGDGVFVAVGQSGVISTSVDAVSWSRGVSSTTSELLDVAYGAGVYVAVGLGGIVRVSTDGAASWINYANANFGTDTINGVRFIAGLFFAVGGISASKITSSTPAGTTGTWVVRNFASPVAPLVSIASSGPSMVALSPNRVGIATKSTALASPKTIVLKQLTTNVTAL